MNTILQVTRSQTQITFAHKISTGHQKFSIDQKDIYVAIPKLQRWAADLRENRNAQGCGRLQYLEDDQDKYCCLGILGKNLPTFSNYFSNTFLIEEDFKALTGLESLSDASMMQFFFSSLNDDHLFTFEEIAIVIEKLIAFFQSDEPMFVIME